MRLDAEARTRINDWNRANKRARDEYSANPITTSNGPVEWKTCSGDCGYEILARPWTSEPRCKPCRDALYNRRKKERRAAEGQGAQ